MRVTFAHLCDYALISKEGKLSILGMFSGMQLSQIPAVQPMMYLAFEIELSPAELNRDFSIRIECTDEDGNRVFQSGAKARVDAKPKPGKRPRFAQVITIRMMQVRRVGPHSIHFWLNEHLDESHTVVFDVELIGQQPPPAIQGKAPPALPPGA